jgi:translocation and assembly module TamB
MNAAPDPQPEPGEVDVHRTPLPRHRVARIALTTFLWILGILVVAAAGLSFYATTPSFQNRVRHAVIAQVEKATGGRVELGHFGWRLSHLEFEVDDLTIHGLEAPDQVPYAHLDRLFVRLQILSFFRAKVGLNYLEADHPVFHLIIYPDGTTNQPKPKTTSTGNTKDQIFNLAINRTVLKDGVAILNERRIPFDLSAKNLRAEISYVPARDHYIGTIRVEDISAQRGNEVPVHSVLDATIDTGRNSATLESLTLQSGPEGAKQRTVVRIAGSLENFVNPKFQFTIRGAVDALEIRALTGTPGLSGGIAQIVASGHGTASHFAIDGTGRISGGAYHIGTVHISGVTAQAVAHITQNDISVSEVRASLGGGSSVKASLKITNWQNPAGEQPQAAPERGAIHAQVAGFSIDRVLDLVSPPNYRRLGFDTSASGTADVEWTGPPENFTGAVNVGLTTPHPPVAGEVPITGQVAAAYVNRTGTVLVRNVDLQTPASHIRVEGNLGVYPLTRQSHLTVSVTSSDVAEFRQVLSVAGVNSNTLPAQVHGNLDFEGEVDGNLKYPGVSGRLEATNVEVSPGSVSGQIPSAQPVHFDSMTAQAEYRQGSLVLQSATLLQGPSRIQLSGEIHAQSPSGKDLFDPLSTIHGKLSIQNASLAQWVALTGKNVPVSGTLNLQAQTSGTLGDLNGNGHLTITGGSIDGEPYHSLTSDILFRGRTVSLSDLVFSMDGGKVTGHAGFDLATKSANFDLDGTGFQLAGIPRLQSRDYPISGAVAFDAKGSGTLQNPSLQANLHIRNLTLARESTGFVNAEAHTEGQALLLHLTSHLNTATVDLNDRTELRGEYQTHATLDIVRLDIDPLLRTFSVTGIRGNSSIAAHVAVSGPLRSPRRLSGDARISQLNIDLENVPIHSDGAIHAALSDGVLHLDPLHIVGTDTDLRAQGTVGILTQPRALQIRAGGSINMGLLQTLDTRIISSGHIDFNLDATGTTASPVLQGQAKFVNVNVALENYINGLSRMNGTLAFYQNRLGFQDVTAYSGGGPIKIGGFVTYRHGLFADLTATASGVRIRYPQGVTATADAKITVQGTTASSFVSGNVTITGFSVSSNIDLASIASSTSGVSLPPNPDSPTKNIRLDIRIHSAPSLDFQNSFAKLAGNVALVVRGTVAQPTVLGRVVITEGSATFNGARFQLQHGDIYFTNPVRIQPIVDVIATTTVEDYNITISVQGTTSKLTPTFRSEPPLSEQDIFSLLAMGRTQEEQQIYSTEQAQAGVNTTADALLGGALNATLSNRIQKLFGGGSVRIDPTFVSGIGNATARITITEPISKQATLTYATNVNSTAEQLIQGEWRITPDISVLAVRDEAGVFSLIFRLHRRYH